MLSKYAVPFCGEEVPNLHTMWIKACLIELTCPLIHCFTPRVVLESSHRKLLSGHLIYRLPSGQSVPKNQWSYILKGFTLVKFDHKTVGSALGPNLRVLILRVARLPLPPTPPPAKKSREHLLDAVSFYV